MAMQLTEQQIKNKEVELESIVQRQAKKIIVLEADIVELKEQMQVVAKALLELDGETLDN